MVYINHQYKFVFIENPKTGSTSFLQAFDKALGIKISRDPIQSHRTVAQVKALCPGLEDYTWISTKRDPFKRFCSCMNYELHGKRLKGEGGPLIEYWDWDSFDGLKAHVMNPRECIWCIPQELFTEDCHMIIDLDGDIQKQWKQMCVRLDMPGQDIVVEHKNFTKETKYGIEELRQLYDLLFRG